MSLFEVTVVLIGVAGLVGIWGLHADLQDIHARLLDISTLQATVALEVHRPKPTPKEDS